MLSLDGKVLLVTGAGRGIGAAIAREAAALGGDVVLHDAVSGPEVRSVQMAIGDARACVVATDLGKPEDVPTLWREALAWRGHIDVLVNNAGIYEKASVRVWDKRGT